MQVQKGSLNFKINRVRLKVKLNFEGLILHMWFYRFVHTCLHLCVLYYPHFGKGVHVALHFMLHVFTCTFRPSVPDTLRISHSSSLLTGTSHWLPLIGLHFLPATLPSLLPHSTNTVLWPPGAQVLAHK